MERLWNYIFYSTWKLQISLGEIIIERPLIYIFNLFPFLKKNWNKGEYKYKRLMHSEDGFNIGFTFSFMFWTTILIYSGICLLIVKLLDVEVGEAIYYYFTTVVILTYMTNYLCIYRLDIYKKYFDEYDALYEKNKKIFYLHAILFHISAIVFCGLSIHWTVGFNL